MANNDSASFKERAASLEAQWEQLKKEYQEQPWVRRRIDLIQKNRRTPEETAELEFLSGQVWQDHICGTLEDRALDTRLGKAVLVLERAAETEGKSNGK